MKWIKLSDELPPFNKEIYEKLDTSTNFNISFGRWG